MRVGVVGYSAAKFDVDKARLLVDVGLSYFRKQYDGKMFEVVSGLTNLGVPALAYAWAADNKVFTVGIACSKATEYDCYPVDHKIIEGSEWGDESDTFLEYIDVMLRIGGGKQSLEEAATFTRKYPHKAIIELELPERK